MRPANLSSSETCRLPNDHNYLLLPLPPPPPCRCHHQHHHRRHHHHHHHHHHNNNITLITILIIIIHMLHCLEHLYADSGFHLGGVYFFILRFFCLQHLARDDYCIGGFSLAGPNRFCNPTTALLIIIIILIFIFILILSILIILIIPILLIILIILIILFVLIIVVINSFLLQSLSSSSVSFIVLVSNLINIKRLALFVICSNSKKPRETVAPFRLQLANPPLPYPSPVSFRTSPPGLKFLEGRS